MYLFANASAEVQFLFFFATFITIEKESFQIAKLAVTQTCQEYGTKFEFLLGASIENDRVVATRLEDECRAISRCLKEEKLHFP